MKEPKQWWRKSLDQQLRQVRLDWECMLKGHVPNEANTDYCERCTRAVFCNDWFTKGP